MEQSNSPQVTSLTELMNDASLNLLDVSGSELVQRISMDAVRTVVLDVLSGRNLRDSTEVLTRRRLAALNAATVAMVLKGTEMQSDFVEQLPTIAARILERGRLSRSERWVAQWALGLTDKASQNVLRDDASLLAEYRERYVSTCEEVIRDSIAEFGDLGGEIRLGDDLMTNLSWKFMVYLLGAVGAQTLTIRGSEKSAYGKLFERLVLGALLHILGFRFVGSDGPSRFEREFWLSSQGERRESDATALWQAGQGVRFDIGFIGRGNPEISLDKVSRFTREIELGRSKWYMATIIVVDRIGRGSRIKDLAREMDGDIVQMSMTYWPQEVAQILRHRMDFQHPLVDMPHAEINNYLKEAIKSVPLADYLP
ncbi:MAG: CfrBI family restriction endonuclease [Planctomycetes bacterium]|nr:CfrBI family restriction endonuclease [Planctomycetota bacterium]